MKFEGRGVVGVGRGGGWNGFGGERGGVVKVGLSGRSE